MIGRPNILFILSDQHRADVGGVHGNEELYTPNLDRMAAQGASYSNCVSVAPICAPYRSSLQSGLYPHQHGVTSNGPGIAADQDGVATDLAARGYRTCYIGKCHWNGTGRPGYVPPKARLGWDHWFGYNRGHYYYEPPEFDEQGELTGNTRGLYEPEYQVDTALAFIAASTEPWVVQVNLGPPHTATMADAYARPEVKRRMLELNRDLGFGLPEEELLARPESWIPQHLVDRLVPDRYLHRYELGSLTLQPNIEPELTPLAHYYYLEYYAMLTAVDEQVGRLLDAVEGSDTIVVYTSDHGDQLGSHTKLPERLQEHMPEQGTRVNKGRAKGRPLQNSYRVPLLLWAPERLAAGLTVTAPVNTLDFRPTLSRMAGGNPPAGLSGSSIWPEDLNVDRPPVLLALEDWRAVFDGRWFYAARRRHGTIEPERFTDTLTDPFDLHDLSASPAHDLRRSDMHTHLLQRLDEQADPFLHGEPT